MKTIEQYLKVTMICCALAALSLFCAFALLNGVARQQDYDQRQMVVKCQEGWQSYCRKLVKNHVIIGANND